MGPSRPHNLQHLSVSEHPGTDRRTPEVPDAAQPRPAGIPSGLCNWAPKTERRLRTSQPDPDVAFCLPFPEKPGPPQKTRNPSARDRIRRAYGRSIPRPAKRSIPWSETRRRPTRPVSTSPRLSAPGGAPGDARRRADIAVFHPGGGRRRKRNHRHPPQHPAVTSRSPPHRNTRALSRPRILSRPRGRSPVHTSPAAAGATQSAGRLRCPGTRFAPGRKQIDQLTGMSETRSPRSLRVIP